MKYDDFATLKPDMFEQIAKEYNKQNSGKILSVNKYGQIDPNFESVQKKISELKKIIDVLIKNTKNNDVVFVLKKIKSEVELQEKNIIALVGQELEVLSSEMPQTSVFCNNLKLAIQLCTEIVKGLVMLKDSDNVSQNGKLQLTQILYQFIEITNKFVSLFGECKYRTLFFCK